MESIESLSLISEKITNINGIEKFINLTYLNLGSNNITDISSLKGLTNLKELELRSNEITDISSLKDLTNLTGLDISNNSITDLKILENYSKMEKLIVDGNNINNIEEFPKLQKLKRLSLAENNISNINFLENVTQIEELNLSYNNIENIEIIGKFSNLVELSIGNNESLSDISPLSKCINLEELYIPNNNVSNINALETLKNCKVVIANNHIENLEVIDNTDIELINQIDYAWTINGHTTRPINLNPQYLSITTEETEVQLPQIFIQSQNQNSKLFTKIENSLMNCKLSEDKNSVILEEGIKTATIKIVGGKIGGSTLTINKADKIAPNLTVNYSTKELTNETVTATIVADEPIQQVEGWALQEDEKTLTKIYAKNITENVDVYDIAGNKSTAQIEIINIDNIAPQADIKYSTTKLTNENVKVTITANEKIKPVEGWILSNDQTTLTKGFEENKEEEVTIYDLGQNGRKINISVTNIDKIAPQVEVKYSTTEKTDENVTVTISANEKLQEVEGWIISADRQTLVKEYKKNKQESITVYDLAGNSTVGEITISNIDLEMNKISQEKNDKDNTVVQQVIPKAGKNSLIISSIIFVTILVIVIRRKYNNLKDIK